MGMSEKRKFGFLRAIVSLTLHVVVTVPPVSGQDPISGKILACYFNPGSYFREGMPFEPANIDPSLCTHVIYTYMGMREDNFNIYSRNPSLDYGPGEVEPYPDDPDLDDGELDMIRKTVSLKGENPSLKIMASIGGPLQSSRSFSNMARHFANKTRFLSSVTKFVDTYDLDGIDVFWQYPGMGDGRPEDIETLVVVMTDLRIAFTNLTTFTGKNYTLTVALGCTEDIIDVGYDVPKLAEHVDFFNLHCYDFKIWAPEALIGHHSPLFPSFREADRPADQKLTVEYAVNHFLKMGDIAQKLVLGISAHARTYELGLPESTNFYDLSMGPGPAGSYTRQETFLALFEICDEMNKHPDGWQFRYDHEYKIPFVVNVFDQSRMVWFGYDNEISAIEKVDFAMTKGLGGMMVDFLDLDDYANFCKGWVPYPLTAAIKDRLAYWAAKK